MKKFLWKWIWRFTMFALMALLAYFAWIAAQLLWWNSHAPTSSAFMRARLASLQQKNPRAQLQHSWLEYPKISIHLKRALIAAEDAKFFSHDGFDWDGIQLALEKNLNKGKVVAGGSTISQQLAKNLFLSGERTALRKAEEAMITLLLEAIMDKQRIFEIYLNSIEWGNGVFGAEAAAQHYFGISASALSLPQAAHLAAIVPSPRYFDKHRDSPALQSRTELILGNMQFVALPNR